MLNGSTFVGQVEKSFSTLKKANVILRIKRFLVISSNILTMKILS